MSDLLNLRNTLRESTGDPNFRLDVGSVLSRTLSIGGANIVSFVVVGLVVQSPVLLGLGGIAVSGESMPIAQKLLDMLSNLLTLILTGAVTYGVFQALRGEPAGVGDVLRFGLARLGTVWWTAILTGLATMLGILCFLIPGLVLMTRFWVAVPVAVIEAPGASQAIDRSADLTAGNRWRVFALALISGVIVFAFTMLAGAAFGMIESALAPGANRDQFTAWAQAALELVIIPLQAMAAVAPAIAYHDLRVGKEGVDVEELLKAFE
jgi:hypothetical protein